MPSAILVLGLLTVVYTWKGGMRAVVWTELIQAGVYLLGGISALILLGHAVDGGWSAILATFADSSNPVKGQIRLFNTNDPSKWLLFNKCLHACHPYPLVRVLTVHTPPCEFNHNGLGHIDPVEEGEVPADCRTVDYQPFEDNCQQTKAMIR